ncbi:RNA polymerase II-associated protein 3 [Copidosoma floridanum]|uniref:RNA polymerase II-associated protein 3 n=1 Tax=Copidosoma floridanum TaxID=29053 RepID=UPI0006C9C76D|nr:RNA polymerase II-associated protein 3 [Copidosoma floridanum]XP_014212468.1 RNA polymerase II-associated protein 3 [Copidosoma floridanum]
MDKAILLQKQVRENSEDLQKELRDMVAWEEEMKRKDFEIRNATNDQELPPVRCKKKKKTLEKSNNEEEQSKEKKIAGFDYKSWEKFDADKACKEIDGENVLKGREEKEFEIPSKEELEKEHAEASVYKDEGNALVQKKEYAKAVGKYSQAIKIFPHDAIFYANRALCQLKLANLHSADADCTQAIKLDGNYIKAYHRRATARMELKRYKDAQKDFEKILELDPTNKEASLKLKQVEEKINKAPKPLILAGEGRSKSSIEKTIGEKLFGKSTAHSNSEISNTTSKQITEKSGMDKKSSSNGSKHKPLIEEVIEKTDGKKSKNEMTLQDELPPWLPKLKEGVSVIQPLKEAPRVHKKALKKINIQEISEKESIFSGIVEENLVEEKTLEQNNAPTDVKNDAPKDVKNEPESNHKQDSKPNIEVIEDTPQVPKTSVGFFLSWRKSVSSDYRYRFLKQIMPRYFPSIIKSSMEASILSDIISVLNTKFVANGDHVYDWLYYLSKLERFRALILFMPESDKEVLKSLLEYCKTTEGKTGDEIDNLRTMYEL